MATRHRKLHIREHLKFLLRIRSNWSWWTGSNTGFFQGKVNLITRGGELLLTKQQLELHIARTKHNLEKHS